MPHEPEMTPIELELERALRTLAPAPAAAGSSAELAFALGRASMARRVARWRAGCGVLGTLLLAGAGVWTASAPRDAGGRAEPAPTAAVSPAASSLIAAGDLARPVAAPRDATVELEPEIATAALTRRPPNRFVPAHMLRQASMLRRVSATFDSHDPTLDEPSVRFLLSPVRRPLPARPSSLNLLLELLSPGAQS